MSEVTRILSKIDEGDPSAAEDLLPLVYDEPRLLAAAKLAQERQGQTLQATALVHEAYLRLVDNESTPYNSRPHFFAAAAEAMRRILVDRARQKLTLKRGGAFRARDIDSHEPMTANDDRLATFVKQVRLGADRGNSGRGHGSLRRFRAS